MITEGEDGWREVEDEHCKAVYHHICEETYLILHPDDGEVQIDTSTNDHAVPAIFTREEWEKVVEIAGCRAKTQLETLVNRIRSTIETEQEQLKEYAQENPGMSGRNTASLWESEIEVMKKFLDGIDCAQ
jgi:hypothetical protein